MTEAKSQTAAARRRITTTKITAEDLPTVVHLLGELADYEGVRDIFRATVDGLRAVMFSPQPILLGLIARVDGEPAGIILGYETYSTFAATKRLFIEDLVVRAEDRGAGVGRALIAKYGRLCLNLGYGGLHWRVLDANEAGIGFYQAIGAEVSTEHRNCGLSGPALQALVEAAAPIERVLS